MAVDSRCGATVAVVGSLNRDLTLTLDRLPSPGETLLARQALRGSGGTLVLGGDIGARSERRIAGDWRAGRAPLVLLLPHHGSRFSSSAALLAALRPSLALVSAGYRSAYGHPHGDVRARLAARGVALFNTAEAGALHLRVGADGPRLRTLRGVQPRWWRE